MTPLTPREIQRMTGVPKSTLARHLARFRAARVGHGQYDPTEPQFGAWLTLYSLSDKPHGSHERREEPRPEPRRDWRGPYVLPSGVIIGERCWELLRGPDESAAIARLDRLIDHWRLSPHPAVPDLMPFERMELPSGRVVNATQWRALRGRREKPAAAAFDVLLRSWGALP